MLTILAPISTNSSDKTLADQLLALLLERIVSGELQPGSKLNEPELSRSYQVSRGPLREAIRRLQSKRLVEVTPNSGARVVPVCRERLVAVYQTREALEGMAARLFAERGMNEEVAGLEQLLSQHELSIAADQGRRYTQEQGDLDFHYRVAQGSGNPSLIAMLCDDLYYLVRLYRHRAPAVSGIAEGSLPKQAEGSLPKQAEGSLPKQAEGSTHQNSRAMSALKEHQQIAEAIAAGDGELAELLMRRHISRARVLAEKAFIEEEAHVE